MSRVKRGIIHTKKRKRVLRLAKGYRGGRGNLYAVSYTHLRAHET